jgi:hypothetical protein
MKQRSILLVALLGLLRAGCETARTEKNLVDGTEKRKGGWFHMEAQKYEPEPHKRRVDDLLAYPRR